jgi:septal ring factor EnvC (AmiA/AmiB activator)
MTEEPSEISPDQLVLTHDGRPASPPQRSKGRLLLTTLVAVVGGVLFVTAGGASYLAFVNRERADRWEVRASALQRDLTDLNNILVTRSDELNERTAQANSLATKVETLQQAVNRSEKDVHSLERRQRQLANEKAQVEDQRGALALQAATLQTVAQTYSDCSHGLNNLLQAVVYENYGWINANADGIVATCNQAEAAFSAYGSDYAE